MKDSTSAESRTTWEARTRTFWISKSVLSVAPAGCAPAFSDHSAVVASANWHPALPPQLNLVIEIEFADATTALWSENAGPHPAGATLSTDFEIQNVRVLASQVVLDSALLQPSAPLRKVPGVSHPTAHTQQSSVPNGVAEHNVTVARAFTKLMGAFVTFWDNDAGSKIHLLANPGQDVAPIGAARQEDSLLESQMQLGSLQYPRNPMKGASEHFHFLSVLAGTYDDTVRNIDIGRVGYLRHSFIAGFPTERGLKMPLSGVSTRSGEYCPVYL